MAKKKGGGKVITYHCQHAIQLPNLYMQVSNDGRSRRRTMDRQHQDQRLRQSPSQAEKTTWLMKKTREIRLGQGFEDSQKPRTGAI
jgi:hypothetical protein